MMGVGPGGLEHEAVLDQLLQDWPYDSSASVLCGKVSALPGSLGLRTKRAVLCIFFQPFMLLFQACFCGLFAIHLQDKAHVSRKIFSVCLAESSTEHGCFIDCFPSLSLSPPLAIKSNDEILKLSRNA